MKRNLEEIISGPLYWSITCRVHFASTYAQHFAVQSFGHVWLRPHGLQHTRLPCPSLSPGICSNSSPLSRWCHPTISYSVIPFSFCLQSFPASVLPMNIQGWFPLEFTDLISLLSKWLWRVSSSTTVQKHQLFHAQPSFWSSSHIYTWLLEKP